MRNALCGLLLLVGTSLFAAKNPQPQSPTVSVSIATEGAACLNGINRAVALSTAPDGVTHTWKVINGAVLAGQGTTAILYTAYGEGAVVVSVTVNWGGVFTTQTAVPVFGAPAILSQPKSTAIAPGGSATLSVAATDDALFYDWYEGPAGDTSKLVIANTTQFKTPPLTKSVSYWVRVSNRCSAALSQAAKVTISGKRRAAGH